MEKKFVPEDVQEDESAFERKASEPISEKKKLTFENLVDATHLLNKWRSVCIHRKQVHHRENLLTPDQPKAIVTPVLDDGKPADALDSVDGSIGHQRALKENKNNLNRSLLHYFIHISSVDHPSYTNNLDIEFICTLLSEGADINTTDSYGQTILHEVAKNWDQSVMSVLIDLGGEPNLSDYRGRTPLHVAAATNYPEMCKTLIKKGANREARTKSGQTPLFFAAKTDSAKSLQALIAMRCHFDDVYDSMGRTPLYCASELDRSETAAILLEHGADAFVQDSSGQIAFVPMVEKMPPVAKEAMSQLHKTFRIERKQQFHLYRLDPKPMHRDEEINRDDLPREEIDKLLNAPYFSVLKAITNTGNYTLIESPVVKQLIRQQWLQYGRLRAVWQVILQLITIVMWTVFAVAKEWTHRFEYKLPEEIYRIVIMVAAIGLTVYSIVEEISEYLRARKRHAAWQKWRLDRLYRDLEHCHAKQNDEKDYLNEEIEKVKDTGVSYFEDAWNYLDWLCYVILIVALMTHFIDVGYPGGQGNLVCARWHVRFLAVNIVLLWLRLLKYVKPFEFFGPFIVMLGMIISDVVKFLLLYLEFFIPFACVFWTILGGTNNLREADVVVSGTLANYSRYNLTKVSVQYFDTVNNMLFSLFRLTLVDEYDYNSMVEIDQVTSQLLLGAWFAVSTILFLNLFIAQLSETFKAVYDNAKAAAAMQKAMTLNSYYETMMRSSKIKYHRRLQDHCNPLVEPYDDDVTNAEAGEELQKATLQIRDTVQDMKVKFDRLYKAEIYDSDDDDDDGEDGEPRPVPKSRQMADELTSVNERLSKLERSVQQQLKDMRGMLRDIAIVVTGIGPDPGVGVGVDAQRQPPQATEAEEEEEVEEVDDDKDEVDAARRTRQRVTSARHRITEVQPAAK